MAVKGKEISNPRTGQSIKFVQTKKDTNGQFLEMVSTYESQSKEPPLHYHPMQDEFFEVTKGELSVRVNGQLLTLYAGDKLHIPRNTRHSMWNDTVSRAVVKWKVIPALNTENLLETISGLASEGRTNKDGHPPFLQLALIANKYSNVFRLAKPSFLVQKVLFSLIMPFSYLAGYRAKYKRFLD